jgi:hypothetical protein
METQRTWLSTIISSTLAPTGTMELV